MTTIQISDPWFENLYNREFEANPKKFIETIKTLLVEKYQKEKRVVFLLSQYKDAQLSIGKIAENFHISREKVLSLLAQHNIDFVDYSLVDEKKNVDDSLLELKK